MENTGTLRRTEFNPEWQPNCGFRYLPTDEDLRELV
jgi:hypothetical protein